MNKLTMKAIAKLRLSLVELFITDSDYELDQVLYNIRHAPIKPHWTNLRWALYRPTKSMAISDLPITLTVDVDVIEFRIHRIEGEIWLD